MDCSLVRTLVQRYVSAALGRTGNRAGTRPGDQTPPPPAPDSADAAVVPEGLGGLVMLAASRGTSRTQEGPAEFAPLGFRRVPHAHTLPRPPPAPGPQPRLSPECALGWSNPGRDRPEV